MNIPEQLRRKYSYGTIPQWELDKLAESTPVEAEKKKPGRPRKVVEVEAGDESPE